MFDELRNEPHTFFPLHPLLMISNSSKLSSVREKMHGTFELSCRESWINNILYEITLEFALMIQRWRRRVKKCGISEPEQPRWAISFYKRRLFVDETESKYFSPRDDLSDDNSQSYEVDVCVAAVESFRGTFHFNFFFSSLFELRERL